MIYAELEVLVVAVEADTSTASITELSEAQLVLVGGGQGDIQLG